MLELNKMATIEAKLDAIVNRLNNQEGRSHNVNEVGLRFEILGIERQTNLDELIQIADYLLV